MIYRTNRTIGVTRRSKWPMDSLPAWAYQCGWPDARTERVRIGCGVGFATIHSRVFSRIINTVRQRVGAMPDRFYALILYCDDASLFARVVGTLRRSHHFIGIEVGVLVLPL